MGSLKHFKISILFALLFISLTAQFGVAIRPWHWQGKILPDFESLQRGPVTPSSHSPCTNIPGQSGICVNEINAAGHLLPSPPTYPDIQVVKFSGTTSMGE
ncbi:hypothetical protein HRI_003411900 [Hibiscus trionum]|uniref:Uncharacterized protein n=1 Tax=Hibiscus trionum TaxID=183268 RepID=A0A9W7IKY5_HIBTR|nr:hypothetical protein HRI_003411900 [Hibiscus trionum]